MRVLSVLLIIKFCFTLKVNDLLKITTFVYKQITHLLVLDFITTQHTSSIYILALSTVPILTNQTLCFRIIIKLCRLPTSHYSPVTIKTKQSQQALQSKCHAEQTNSNPKTNTHLNANQLQKYNEFIAAGFINYIHHRKSTMNDAFGPGLLWWSGGLVRLLGSGNFCHSIRPLHSSSPIQLAAVLSLPACRGRGQQLGSFPTVVVRLPVLTSPSTTLLHYSPTTHRHLLQPLDLCPSPEIPQHSVYRTDHHLKVVAVHSCLTLATARSTGLKRMRIQIYWNQSFSNNQSKQSKTKFKIFSTNN